MNNLIPAPELPDEDVFKASISDDLNAHLENLQKSREKYEKEDEPYKKPTRYAFSLVIVYIIVMNFVSGWGDIIILTGWCIHSVIMLYIMCKRNKTLTNWVERDKKHGEEWDVLFHRMQQEMLGLPNG